MIPIASSSEIERLRRLHRGTAVGLHALRILHERSPDDEVQLRTLSRLERRLSDRIEWMEANHER